MVLWSIPKAKYFLILVSLMVIFFCPSIYAEVDLSGQSILDRVDDLFRSRSSHGTMSMTIKTAHWTRTLTIEVWSKGKENSLIRILAPKKEKGTTTLRSGNNIWNYLPKVNRVIKLPSSMMASSWMGSHFTNDDLVKESRMADDYTFEITFKGIKDNREIIEVTCYPKPEAAVVWGKILVKVSKEDLMPMEILYCDEDMNLARTMIFSDIGELGGRRLPKIMLIIPTDKPDEYTKVEYHEMLFDIDLQDDLFSIRSLQR